MNSKILIKKKWFNVGFKPVSLYARIFVFLHLLQMTSISFQLAVSVICDLRKTLLSLDSFTSSNLSLNENA